MNKKHLTGIVKFLAIAVILLCGLTATVNAGPVPSKNGENIIEIAKRDSGSHLAFIHKMYNGFFNKPPTKNEEKDALKMDGANLARKLVKSRDFYILQTSNEDYIKLLYKGMLFREYDNGGYNFWKNQLNSGLKKRDDILRDFAYSEEFRLLCLKYGVTRGSI